MKKTLVIGASNNPHRHSFMAVNKLIQLDHPVVLIGIKKGAIANHEIVRKDKVFKDVDTITLYLNPKNQKEYYLYILETHPKRVIFNPGTENPGLQILLKENGIEFTEVCTLVLLSTGEY